MKGRFEKGLPSIPAMLPSSHRTRLKNLSVYQGIPIGRNVRPRKTIHNPTTGDNVQIDAGAEVMKDVPANSIVIGNPCVMKSRNAI